MVLSGLLNLFSIHSQSPLSVSPASLCSPEGIPFPSIFGGKVLSITANLVQRSSYVIPHDSPYTRQTTATLRYCNVTVSHTHPGWDDVLRTQIWLPAETWNGRMQGIGGAGMIAGLFPWIDFAMASSVNDGYATMTVDAGLPSWSTEDWALLSPGNVNKYHLENLASRSLADGTLIAKSVIKSFYGEPPKYSYWSGCSQGGRQGMMLAQRYPTLYDGIHASAPAINWNSQLAGNFWPQQVMNEMGHYPLPCELDALTDSAIAACDGLDGVKDDLISDMDACHFDPFTLVGKQIFCFDVWRRTDITEAAAIVADAMWAGSNGSSPAFMPGYQASMTAGSSLSFITCDRYGTCRGRPSNFWTDWIRLFVKKDPFFDYKHMSREEFVDIVHQSIREYSSIIDTYDSDLSGFRRAGGKILTYHGLADDLLPYKNTRLYYEAVTQRDPNVADFYRYFEAPGLGHCAGNIGPAPNRIFDSLVDWVENGKVPESLKATGARDRVGNVRKRILCPYPQKARYDGDGDLNSYDSWSCH